MIKSPGEIRNTWEIPLHNEGNLQQSCSQHQLKWSKTQSNSSKTRDRTLSPYLFNIGVEVVVRIRRWLKEIKGIQIGKKTTKVSLFGDGMTVYICDLKNSTRKLQQLINTFSKVARYKINSQKSVALYTQMANGLRKKSGKLRLSQ